MTMWRNALMIIMLCTSAPAFAQDARGLSEGTAFAETIKPNTPRSIVNPSGVEAAAWSSTTMPTEPPPQMGAFSNPTDGNSIRSDASALGLMGLGLKAQNECANYVMGTDPLRDQECAAVNFMNNRCLPRTEQENAVLASAIPAPSAGLSDCTGTFGNGLTNAGLFDTIDEGDSLFSTINTAQANAVTNLTDPNACSMTTMITQAAEYDVYQCFQSLTTTAEYCSLTLSAEISTTRTAAIETSSCSTGVLQGNYCIATTTGDANPIYTCAPGYTLSGTTCTQILTSSAIPIYSCPTGSTLTGTNCIDPDGSTTPATINGYSCPPGQTLSGNTCTQTITTAATIATYECDDGYTLNGYTCEKDTTNTVAATAVYSCDDNLILSGTLCTGSNTSNAEVHYYCPAYWTLSGSSCIPPDVILNTYHCYPGRVKVDNNGQVIIYGWTMPTYHENAMCTFSFPVESTAESAAVVCQRLVPTEYDNVSSLGSIINPSAYNTDFFTGLKTVSCRSEAISGCDNGYTRVGNRCEKTTASPITALVSGYTCDLGQTVSGSNCITYINTTATVSYSCTNGTLSGNTCIVTTTTTTAATPVYSCPDGYTVSGSNCIQQSSYAATPIYSCPANTTLSGADCVGSTTTPATIEEYTCQTGETLSGTNCIRTDTQAATLTGYSCPPGSSLSGTSCITITSMPATITYSCIDGSAPDDGLCFIKTVQTSWTDTCLPYEISAGSMLPLP